MEQRVGVIINKAALKTYVHTHLSKASKPAHGSESTKPELWWPSTLYHTQQKGQSSLRQERTGRYAEND